jgi:hypothetical protein
MGVRARFSNMLGLKNLVSVPVRKVSFSSLLFTAVLLQACGGGSSSSTVASINISPTSGSVSVNGSQTFTATALDSNGQTVTNQTFTWASSNTAIATITAAGVATGVTAGSTQITANTAGITSTAATLTVNPAIATVALTPLSATIKVGQTQQFTASATDASGNSVKQAQFTWHNSFGGVASIDANGLATALAPGTVMITASASGMTSQVATLTVTQ